MSSTPTFVGTPKIGLQQIVPADTSTLKTLVTAGASGSKVTSIMAASDDSSARIVAYGITRGGTFYQIGAVSVAITSGTDGATAATNLLSVSQVAGLPIDADGQRYLLLQSGDTLQVKTTTTVTSAKTVHLVATYGDF